MAQTIPSRVNLAHHQLAQLREARGDAQGKEAWMWMRARTHRPHRGQQIVARARSAGHAYTHAPRHHIQPHGASTHSPLPLTCQHRIRTFTVVTKKV